LTEMQRRSKRTVEEANDRPSKKPKQSNAPSNAALHPAWSVLIPRLSIAIQMRLSMTCLAFQKEAAACANYQLRILTKKLDADVNLARQFANPAEKLELPNPGWPFYRALLQMAKIWKAKKKTKSALAILRKAQNIAMKMIVDGVGPDLKKMGKRRVDPDNFVQYVARWERRQGDFPFSMPSTVSIQSADWWIEPNNIYNRNFFRVHDLATSEVWKFRPNFEDKEVAENFDRGKGVHYSKFWTSGKFLFCWGCAEGYLSPRAVELGFYRNPTQILILDLESKRQHWLFNTESPTIGLLKATRSFRVEGKKLKFECIYSNPNAFIYGYNPNSRNIQTMVSYEVSLPDFTHTVVSTVPYTMPPVSRWI